VSDSDHHSDKLSSVDQAVAEGGAYEIIRARLNEQGRALLSATKKLNAARTDEFGSTDMSVSGRMRTRTENNCVARDIVRVGDTLVFGYNVFIGLKKETTRTRAKSNILIIAANVILHYHQNTILNGKRSRVNLVFTGSTPTLTS